MGSALARTLIGAGCKITVWNRSAEKMDEFVKLGASGASSVAEADETTSGPASFVAIDPDGNPIQVDQHVQ
jgi:3-hydroxyisobutyrate dehydrogenase-like beta-hydroxyacid dehydrogenase